MTPRALCGRDAPSVLVKTEVPVKLGELAAHCHRVRCDRAGPGRVKPRSACSMTCMVADLAVGPGQTVKAGDALMRVLASAAMLSAV